MFYIETTIKYNTDMCTHCLLSDQSLKCSSERSRSTEYRDLSSRSYTPPSVLVIADQIEVLAALKSTLQSCGFNVDTLNDPALALDYVSRQSYGGYDIIISNLVMMMPVMKLFNFLSNVRLINPETRIFVMSRSEDIELNPEISAENQESPIFDPASIEIDGVIDKPVK